MHGAEQALKLRYRGPDLSRVIQRLAFAAILSTTGCRNLGPSTVPHDRFEYNGALAESWKAQMLLNLVKIRYNDAPVFLDVGEVVAGYSMSGSVNASASIPTIKGPLGAGTTTGNYNLGGAATYNIAPTIIYTPLKGEKFARAMMQPIPPAAIMGLTQAGNPVDLVFRLAVQSINGLDNRRSFPLHVRPGRPGVLCTVARPAPNPGFRRHRVAGRQAL